MFDLSLLQVITFIICICIAKAYMNFTLRKTQLAKDKIWRTRFNQALLVNVVGFFSIAMLFYLRYGYITDDVNYFKGGTALSDLNFFYVKSGTEFMFWLSHIFIKLFQFDIASFHILFGMIGFCGSLNFLRILLCRSDFSNKKYLRLQHTAFWVIMCFPNFLAWGRFYGKDSTMLFFVSLVALGVYKLLSDYKITLITLLFQFVIPFYCMYLLRPHIALALGIGFGYSLFSWVMKKRQSKNSEFNTLLKVYVPILIIVFGGVFGSLVIKRLAGKDSSISKSTIENTLASTTIMGASGGSQTELVSDLNETSTILFKPLTIANNIVSLLFAPFPWQVRNIIDIIALISNIMLAYILIKFGKNLKLFDIYQKFLFVGVICLIVLLSFMAGNIGLLLRQKTIILPLLFLLLFSQKTTNENKTVANSNNLPKPSYHT